VFVALGTKQAKFMCRIILPSVACLTLPYTSTLPYKRQDFRKKTFTEHKICVLIVSVSFV